jgi:hypothetical protein
MTTPAEGAPVASNDGGGIVDAPGVTKILSARLADAV